MQWLEIIGFGVGIAGIIFGGAFALKWRQAVNFLKEVGEAFTSTANALEDKNLTKDEAVALLKEWNDVVVSIMVLIRK